jgi:hypothetical protein
MITILVSLLIGFIGGFIAGIRNASSSKVEKAVDILRALKSKD